MWSSQPLVTARLARPSWRCTLFIGTPCSAKLGSVGVGGGRAGDALLDAGPVGQAVERLADVLRMDRAAEGAW
jgi:hypothetical protein